MYKHCITEQAARRQRELEAGFLAAMASQAYEDITISSLCDSLGIPRKSFYRYFSSKEGALYALIDHTLADFSGEVFSEDPAATIATLEHFFDFWKDHSALLDALQRSGLSMMLVQRAIPLVLEDNLFAPKLLPFSAKFAQEYVITFLVSGLVALVIQWHHTGFKESSRQLAIIAARLATQQSLDPSDPT